MTVDIKKDASLPPEIARYQAILKNDPGSMVFALLAEAYRRAGMLDEAIAAAQNGLKLHPNYLSGMVALGRAYFEKGMLREAREELEKALAISPDNIIAANIIEEIKQKSEAGSRKSEEMAELEVEPAVIEPAELEEVAEIEEVEAEKETISKFGEEITDELWTGESITEVQKVKEEKATPRKEITTETIAELYIKQGYRDKAIDIYKTLHDAHPENEEIKRKLEELKGKVKVEAEVEKPLIPAPSTSSGQAFSREGRGGKIEEKVEDVNINRLQEWLKTIQRERKKV